MSGPKIAALCGFYPNRLGFCGPQNNPAKQVLLTYLSGDKSLEEKVRRILKGFVGQFFYYKLIARSNNIKDPFDERVVKAYWIGNQLLEKVPINSLRKMVAKDFSKPGLLSLKIAKEKARKIPLTSKPHHSFHVLIIGSVTSRVVLEGKLLDLCRIGWGKVIEYKKFKGENGLIIRYQPLQHKNKKYSLEKSVPKFVFWNKNFIPRIKRGDMISTHWGHVVQTLNKRDLINLKKYTQITIDSLNN